MLRLVAVGVTAPREVPAPLATFGSEFSWHGCLAHPPVLGCLALLVLVGAAYATGMSPWGAPAIRVATPVLALVVVAGAVAASRWGGARAGFVELFADRLAFHDVEERSVVLPLSDVVAFDDGSSDFVRVLRRAPPGRDAYTVPTSDEARRAMLLDALMRAGAARDDGQPLPVPRPPGEVLLRVEGERDRTPVLVTIAILVSIAAVAVDATFDLAWLAPLGVVGSFVAALGLASRLGSRVGTVQFRADRIEVDPDGLPLRDPRHVVAWDDLVGWRSRSDVSLELALRARLARGRGPPTNVPTITPEVRAAVEALLASRGVPRLEG